MQSSLRRSRPFLIALVSSITSGIIDVQAATILTASDAGSGLPIVRIEGEFELEDIASFASATAGVSEAIIVLESPGGALEAGIEIGRRIRMRGYTTYVPDGALCSSSCALAWLGGTTRLVGSEALVGFHAAYVLEGSYAREVGYANALVGAYMSEIGLGREAIIFATMKEPDDMAWLSAEVASFIGINARFGFTGISEDYATNGNVRSPQVGSVENDEALPESGGFSILSPNSVSGLSWDDVSQNARANQPEVSAVNYVCNQVEFWYRERLSSYENIQVSVNFPLSKVIIRNTERNYVTSARILSNADEWIYVREIDSNMSGGLNKVTGEIKLLERDQFGHPVFEVVGSCMS